MASFYIFLRFFFLNQNENIHKTDCGSYILELTVFETQGNGTFFFDSTLNRFIAFISWCPENDKLETKIKFLTFP